MKKILFLAIFSIASVFSTELNAQVATPTGTQQKQEETNKGPVATPTGEIQQTTQTTVVTTTVEKQPATVFGVKAMLGVSNILDNANQSMRLAYGLGLVVDARLSESLSFQPEVLFATKGAKNDLNTPQNKIVTVKTSASYLEIPLLLKLNIEKNGLLVGPYLGFKLSQDVLATYEDKSNTDWLLKTAQYDPEINLLDFGISAGYERKIDEKMSIDVRLNYGLRNITDKSSIKVEKSSQVVEVYPFNNPKNLSFMIGFRYTIR